MHLLLGDGLASWGQAAAIILSIYLFVNILVGLALTAALMFLFAWVREKAELIKKIRPNIEVVKQTIETPESVFPVGNTQEKLVQAVQRAQSLEVPQKFEEVQHRVQSISAQIEQGTDRVANTMIEIRARTEMAKGMLKAFFLPGLAKRPMLVERPRKLLPEATGEGAEALPAESEAGVEDVKLLVKAGNEPLR